MNTAKLKLHRLDSARLGSATSNCAPLSFVSFRLIDRPGRRQRSAGNLFLALRTFPSSASLAQLMPATFPLACTC